MEQRVESAMWETEWQQERGMAGHTPPGVWKEEQGLSYKTSKRTTTSFFLPVLQPSQAVPPVGTKCSEAGASRTLLTFKPQSHPLYSLLLLQSRVPAGLDFLKSRGYFASQWLTVFLVKWTQGMELLQQEW